MHSMGLDLVPQEGFLRTRLELRPKGKRIKQLKCNQNNILETYKWFMTGRTLLSIGEARGNCSPDEANEVDSGLSLVRVWK